MTESPFVSVLIPVFNGEKYIAEAIDSVLNQTYKNFELVVCDDGSNDKTAEILKSYKDPRIVILSHPERKGIPFSRNELLERSTGKYVAWLDADDVANPTRLEVQVLFLGRNPHASCCLSNVEVFDKQKSYKTNFPNNPKLNKGVLFFRQPYFFSSCMARTYRDVTFDLYLKRAQDFDYLWKLAQKGELLIAKEVLVKYRLVCQLSKPDVNQTKLMLYYIQKNKFQAIGFEAKKHQIEALVKYLRDSKNCTKQEVVRALNMLKSLSKTPMEKSNLLESKYIKAIYVYQALKAIHFHSLRYIKYVDFASIPLIRQLIKMKM